MGWTPYNPNVEGKAYYESMMANIKWTRKFNKKISADIDAILTDLENDIIKIPDATYKIRVALRLLTDGKTDIKSSGR